jgi:2-aminoadipate transaminase
MDYQALLADRTSRIATNAIREILKVVARPGMVSLAGGIPSPESFPMEILADLTEKVLSRYGTRAFQYDPTEGFPPLRAVLADYLPAFRGISCTQEDVLIASGSQGVLDVVGKIFISKGDRVAVEAPTYLGALQAFNPYEPTYVDLETDEDGLIPESLEAVLQKGHLKLIYLVPNFQNPTGRTIPLPRRQKIAALLKQYQALLIEDDPYGALRYNGDDIPAIKTLAPDHVIYVSTLSKVFAPGLRIGFAIPPEPISGWLVRAKQGVDLHTSTLNQALAAEYISGGHLERHLPNIINGYAPKLQAMLEALERFFPKRFNWSRPEGGMFVWVEGPKGMDMEAIYWKAIEKNVAFVPGKFFYADPDSGLETLRLNFTMADSPVIRKAIEVLADVMRAAEPE